MLHNYTFYYKSEEIYDLKCSILSLLKVNILSSIYLWLSCKIIICLELVSEFLLYSKCYRVHSVFTHTFSTKQNTF